MPSPFPGMDPYLEHPSIWMDFHERFITYCSDALNERLPDAYETRIEARINLVELPESEVRQFRADVAVSSFETAERRGAAARTEAAQGVVMAEPVTLPLLFYDEVRESNVHILRRQDQRLVTVIELLSPTNKSGDGFLSTNPSETRCCAPACTWSNSICSWAANGSRSAGRSRRPTITRSWRAAIGGHSATFSTGRFASRSRRSPFRSLRRIPTCSSISMRCLPQPTKRDVTCGL